MNALDMRDAFFETLYRMAEKDPRIVVLVDDQGAFALEKFRKNLPLQYYNIGIAEQNMINVAAGLAMGGKLPYVYAIATFLSMRALEQINVNLCCMNLPVTLVASGPGFTYAADGPTHHALQDVAIMRSLPGMTVYNPADSALTEACVQLCYETPGTKYVRLEKGVMSELYQAKDDFKLGYKLFQDQGDTLIISTGFMAHTALNVSQQLVKKGIKCGVLDIFRLKPVDAAALVPILSKYRRIITLEENSSIGGLGSLIAEITSDAGLSVRLKKFSLPDQHIYDYGNREWLLKKFGLDADSISHYLAEQR